MSSLVLELQRDAYSSVVSTSDLLRKAFVVTKKLGLTDFEKWISLELNGYLETDIELPQYRVMNGILKAHNPYHGWVDFHIDNSDIAEVASKRGLAQPIGEIENILETQKDDPMCIVYFAPQAVSLLMSIMSTPLTPALQVPKSQIHKITQVVRNIVLEWALKLESDGVLGEGLTFSVEEKQLASSHTYNIDTYIGNMISSQYKNNSTGEKIMGDNYKAGQVGAMGPNSHAHDMTFNQIWNDIQGNIDLPQLANELSKLRLEMKKEALEPEQDVAVSEIAKAEIAAKAGEGSKVLEHLKAGGKFALDVATKIGVALVVETIKSTGVM